MAVISKKKGTGISGPIRSKKRNATSGQQEYGRQASVTVAALTTNTAETYTVSDADAEVGDIVIASPNVAPEAGWGIEAAWVDAAGSIKIRARNHSGSSLTGGALVLNYAITR